MRIIAKALLYVLSTRAQREEWARRDRVLRAFGAHLESMKFGKP